MDTRCHIGLPQWQHSHWHADRPDGLKALQRYAQCFSSVEGNTSFYGAPKRETLLRWLDHTPAHFKFCFKVPRRVSHDAPLRHGTSELSAFLSGLEIAQDRIGIVWLQLSDKLGPESLTSLLTLLGQLPSGFNYGLELRHRSFFAKGDTERELNAFLLQRNINRVMFDTRYLFADTARDAETLEAQRKKPAVPLHVIATGQHPMLRFISPLNIEQAEPALQQWALKVSQWISEGRQPYLFFHTPNNDDSPLLAARFEQILAARLDDYKPAPAWPSVARQEALF